MKWEELLWDNSSNPDPIGLIFVVVRCPSQQFFRHSRSSPRSVDGAIGGIQGSVASVQQWEEFLWGSGMWWLPHYCMEEKSTEINHAL